MAFSDEFKYEEEIFFYKVDNYRDITKNGRMSPGTQVYNLWWRVLLTPEINSSEGGFGSFLHCTSDNDPESNWSCYAEADIEIVPQNKNGVPCSRNIKHLFNKTCFHWGFTHFIDSTRLFDTRNGYIKNDTIIFRVRLKAYRPNCSETILRSALSATRDPQFGGPSDDKSELYYMKLQENSKNKQKTNNLPKWTLNADNSHRKCKYLQNECSKLYEELESSATVIKSILEKSCSLQIKCDDLEQELKKASRDKTAAQSRVKYLERELDRNDNKITLLEDKILKLQFENTCMKEFQEMEEKKFSVQEEIYKDKIKKLNVLVKETQQKYRLKNNLNLMFTRKIKELQMKNENDVKEMSQYREEIENLKEKIKEVNEQQQETMETMRHLRRKIMNEEECVSEDEDDDFSGFSDYGSDGDDKLRKLIAQAVARVSEPA